MQTTKLTLAGNELTLWWLLAQAHLNKGSNLGELERTPHRHVVCLMRTAGRKGSVQNLDSGLWTGPWTGLWTGFWTGYWTQSFMAQKAYRRPSWSTTNTTHTHDQLVQAQQLARSVPLPSIASDQGSDVV